MPSAKLSYFRKKARELWIKGRILKPTLLEIQAFNTGFNMAYKKILTDEKIYRTFNIHWDDSPGFGMYILRNNDEEVIGYVRHANHIPFKYYVVAECFKPIFRYEAVFDQNDYRRIVKELKAKILEDYIKYQESK